ncbi:MAG TPA: hypothetical protein PLE33_05830 [Candidatus Cloacimonas sp.]|nr:hypothetical protein [Candidatus Cloacimonas sp.]HPS60764.1 hypothetical protein [Candidatus Cloacimonas sp.]
MEKVKIKLANPKEMFWAENPEHKEANNSLNKRGCVRLTGDKELVVAHNFEIKKAIEKGRIVIVGEVEKVEEPKEKEEVIEPKTEKLLIEMKRPELEQIAIGLKLIPKDYGNKPKLIAAIEQARTEALKTEEAEMNKVAEENMAENAGDELPAVDEIPTLE